jgi:uncharacterized membrane protein YfcA
MTVWAWTIAPSLAAPLVVWGSCVCQVLGIVALRRRLVWTRSLPFVLGGFFGAPGGALLLPYVDAHLFRFAVGCILLFYCSAALFARHLPMPAGGGRASDAAIGMIGGFLGGISGLSGPVPTIWCTLRGWDMDVQRGVFQSFNLSMQIVTLLTYALNGTLRATMAPAFALVVPVVVLPALAGVSLYRRFGTKTFRRVVLALLLVSGVAMLAPFLFG